MDFCEFIQNDEHQNQLLLLKVFEEYDKPTEGIDSIEDIVPPPELHEVVSDPNFVEDSLKEVESFMDMLECIEPPSLVDSSGDLENILCPETNHFEIIAVPSTHENQGVTKCQLSTSMDSVMEEKSIANVYDLNATVTAPSCPSMEDIDAPHEKFKGMEGVFNAKEIEALTIDKLQNQECNMNSSISEIDDSSCRLQSQEKSVDTLKYSSIKASIKRLEEQFLPYMIENGLRTGPVQASEEVNDEIKCDKPLSYHSAGEVELNKTNCSLSSTSTDPEIKTNFLVTVPKYLVMLNGVQPLTYTANLIIQSRDSRQLIYKVCLKTCHNRVNIVFSIALLIDSNIHIFYIFTYLGALQKSMSLCG